MGARSATVFLLFLSTPAAAFVSLPETITGRVVDVATGKPLAPVYLVASESLTAPSIGHGSVHHCVRSGAAIGTTGEGAKIALPFAGRGMLTGLSPGGVSAAAYTPGYCTLPVVNVHGSTYEYRAVRNTDPPEQRIRFIARELMRLTSLNCQGGKEAEGSESARREIAAALVAEAQSVAQTPYERYLAARVGNWGQQRSPNTTGLPHGRSFAIVDESRRLQRINWNTINTTCRQCSQIAAPSVRAAGSPEPLPAPPPRYVLICRGEGECDLERRNPGGSTYLYELIEDGDAARAEPLLAAGANPNAERYPGGPTGLDRLLGEAVHLGIERGERALETVRVLARDGRATALGGSGKGLRTRASLVEEPHRGLLLSIAEVVETFPLRPAFTPVCESRGYLPPEFEAQ